MKGRVAWRARPQQLSDAELQEGATLARVAVAEHAVGRKQLVTVTGRAHGAAHAAAKLGGETDYMVREKRSVWSRPRVREERHLAAAIGHLELNTANHGAPVVPR